MANVSNLREIFKKYMDSSMKATDLELKLLCLIEDFVKEHGRIDFDENIEDYHIPLTYYCNDDGEKYECLLQSMYIANNRLVFDLSVRDFDDAVYEEIDCDHIEIDESVLNDIVGQIEYSCNKK